MPRGRKPKLNIDTKVNHLTKEEIELREDMLPVYQKQEFIPPESLTKKELKVWDWLVTIFHDMVNCPVSDADRDLMELYCRAKVATDEADAAIKKDPRDFVIIDSGNLDKEGNPKMLCKPNPNYKKRTDNAALCVKLFGELGLSPQSRARAGLRGANAKKKENIFESLFNRSDDDE